MDRRVAQPKQLTLPTWGPPPPCKQALRTCIFLSWPKQVLTEMVISTNLGYLGS